LKRTLRQGQGESRYFLAGLDEAENWPAGTSGPSSGRAYPCRGPTQHPLNQRSAVRPGR
jgi:hypothetical protein